MLRSLGGNGPWLLVTEVLPCRCTWLQLLLDYWCLAEQGHLRHTQSWTTFNSLLGEQTLVVRLLAADRRHDSLSLAFIAVKCNLVITHHRLALLAACPQMREWLAYGRIGVLQERVITVHWGRMTGLNACIAIQCTDWNTFHTLPLRHWLLNWWKGAALSSKLT